MRSLRPGRRSSTAGAQSGSASVSVVASPIAMRACGMPSSSAASADENSAHSRRTASGANSSQAARMAGSIAAALRLPKISRTTSVSPSTRDEAATRPQTGPSRSGGGSAPMRCG